MLSCSLSLVAIVALAAVCNANPTPDAAKGKAFGCTYRIEKNVMLQFPDQYPNRLYDDPTIDLEKCQELCDMDKSCYIATFDPVPNPETDRCVLLHAYGYSNQPTKPSKTKTVIQIVANSCDKPVATPTPFACKPSIATGSEGCKFNVTCNDSVIYPQSYRDAYITRTPEECVQILMGLGNSSSAMTWGQGGNCVVFDEVVGHYEPLKAVPRKNAVSWRIVESSCAKEAATPP